MFLRLECVCRHNMGSETEDSQSRTSSFYGFDGPNDQARTFPVSQFPVPPGFVIPSTEMASSSELHTPLALDDKLLSVMSPVGKKTVPVERFQFFLGWQGLDRPSFLNFLVFKLPCVFKNPPGTCSLMFHHCACFLFYFFALVCCHCRSGGFCIG